MIEALRISSPSSSSPVFVVEKQNHQYHSWLALGTKMFPHRRPQDEEFELPPLRSLQNIPELPPVPDTIAFPAQPLPPPLSQHQLPRPHQLPPPPQFKPLLPPPNIATLSRPPSSSSSTYTLSLPRLPSMTTNPQPSITSTGMQAALVQPRYYSQQHPQYSSNAIYQSGSAPSQQSSSQATTSARPARKEIKRRTKTGCLTCRKRRIKCDERRPVCRNCEKSKRECEGYDPFLPGGGTPLAITPAMQNSPQNFNDFGSIDPTLNETASGRPLPGEYDPNSQSLMTAPPLKIEEILDVGSGMPSPPIPAFSGLEGSDRELVTHLFQHLYAPAIDKFLETRWFSSRGLVHLYDNESLLEKFKVLKSRFIYTPGNNMHEFLVTQSLESHVVWETMLLARQVSLAITATNDPTGNAEVAEGVHDVAKRIDVFEALVTNQQLNTVDALPEPPRSGTTTPAGKPALSTQLLSREQNFWYLTSRFCTLRDDSKSLSENPVQEIESVLLDMRLLLDSRENRDIIYSIAVVRHYGHKMAEKAAAEAGDQPVIQKIVDNHEEDPAVKVNVARRFIQEEASGKGTTQVTQRVCGMAVMAWNKR